MVEVKTKIPTPAYLSRLSEENTKRYEKDVLEGPLFKQILQGIEEATGWMEGHIVSPPLLAGEIAP